MPLAGPRSLALIVFPSRVLMRAGNAERVERVEAPVERLRMTRWFRPRRSARPEEFRYNKNGFVPLKNSVV